jgi:hypothetical protein
MVFVEFAGTVSADGAKQGAFGAGGRCAPRSSRFARFAYRGGELGVDHDPVQSPTSGDLPRLFFFPHFFRALWTAADVRGVQGGKLSAKKHFNDGFRRSRDGSAYLLDLCRSEVPTRVNAFGHVGSSDYWRVRTCEFYVQNLLMHRSLAVNKIQRSL